MIRILPCMDSSRRKTSWLLTSGAESKINQCDSGQLKSYAPLAGLHTPSITDFFSLSATLNVYSSKNRITRLEVAFRKYSIMITLRVAKLQVSKCTCSFFAPGLKIMMILHQFSIGKVMYLHLPTVCQYLSFPSKSRPQSKACFTSPSKR